MLTSTLRVTGRCGSICQFYGRRCTRTIRPLTQWSRATHRTTSPSNGIFHNQRESYEQIITARGLTSQAVPSMATTAKPLVEKSKICRSSKMVLLEWNDGTTARYPFVWLRDNCRCPSCWHHDAHGRIILMENLNVDIEPIGVAMSEDGSKVDIHWPDNHTSPFDTSLLKDMTFKDEVQKKNIRLWGSDLVEQMPTFQFDDIMTDDAKLLNFLEGLRDFGFTVLKGAPAETGPIVKLGERISYLKLTVYGNVVSLKSKIDPHNLGFTGHKLGLHTDLPHYHYPPNITVFHCIKQSAAGGESVFADGFKTALQLREENPEAFQILCDTNCDFINRGQDMIEYYTKCSRPTFRLDRDGNISEVYFCNVARDTRLRMPVEKVYPYYKAIKSYVDLMYRPENTVNFRLQPGDMVVFENTRILHGRNAFEATEDDERHLEIAFLDWDGVYSKIRCLRERLGMSFHEY